MTDSPDDSNGVPIGVIGGSGLYQLDGFTNTEELTIETPFGKPSEVLVRGELAGRTVIFLARHGRGHRILPHEVNHRANIYALRSLGVRFIICITAVGSLHPKHAPRDIVLVSQYYDRMGYRAPHTFFGDGIAAHIAFAEPISTNLREILSSAAAEVGIDAHNGGTYVNMDGPAFSTRAESQINRELGFDVIGMTNLPEAKLAREAEIALATLAMVTDYDSWKTDEEPVTAEMVFSHIQANAATSQRVLLAAIPKVPLTADWPEHQSLSHALVTPKNLWPSETVERLRVILGRFL